MIKRFLTITAASLLLATTPAIAAEYTVNTVLEKKSSDHGYARGWLYSTCRFYVLGWITKKQFLYSAESMRDSWPEIVGDAYDGTWSDIYPRLTQLLSDEPKCLPLFKAFK